MTEKQKINRVLFILDRSGSMRGILPNAIQALNANINALREELAAKKQAATVTLISFSTEASLHFFNKPINEVKEITKNEITADGGTALFDAVGMGIQQLIDLPVGKDEDVSNLVIAITDGEEIHSQKYNADKLRKLMQQVQATDVWTLTFLVPRGYSNSLVNRFNIPAGNVAEWDTSAAGVKNYESQIRKGFSTYTTARAAGQSAVKSFFVDLSSVSTRDVKQLDDLSHIVTVLSVDKDDEIKPFMERKTGAFKKGTVFYQLVGGKDHADKVQDYKKVLILEKGKSQVYGGDDARQVLGLPDATTKIRPGDLDRFDLFIQSTSTNRKIKAGTKVIYMPTAKID